MRQSQKTEHQADRRKRAGREGQEYSGARSMASGGGAAESGTSMMERVLSRKNLNQAYLRVKCHKGAAGIDGMTVEEALPYLKEHRDE